MPSLTLHATLRTAALATLLAAPLPTLATEDDTLGAPVASAEEANVDGRIAALLAEYAAWLEQRPWPTRQEMVEKATELMAEVDVESLDAFQLDQLWLLCLSPEHLDRYIARAHELAAGNDAEAAIATILLALSHDYTTVRDLLQIRDAAEQRGTSNEEVGNLIDEYLSKERKLAREALANALEHPALMEAIQAGHGHEIFGIIYAADPNTLCEHLDEALAVAMSAPDSAGRALIRRISDLPKVLEDMPDEFTPAQREEIRVRIVDAMRDAMSRARRQDERLAGYLERRVTFLEGEHARGKLLDHVSPAMSFTWSSGDRALTSIADLKGKVVVLDFWATWCGPCLASFPNVRELQKHYEGYDVAIIGVTSIQGKHFSGDGPPINTDGDPEKEYELTKEFMVAKNITWTIAFSEANVFNPDYGVRGIPHMAILDAEGKVRYNGLHPSSPLRKKTEKIDALLEESGLAVPPPPGTGAAGNEGHEHSSDQNDGRLRDE